MNNIISDEDIELLKKAKLNKEKLKEYNKEYYSKNKQQILKSMTELIKCENCQCSCTKYHMKRHMKSKLCQKRSIK